MTGRLLVVGATLTLTVAAGAAPGLGQSVPLRTLGAATETYGDGLGSLRGVRELSDGRVLIADGAGEALIVWTPGQNADTLTNIGQGPEEYRVPDGLFPLPNDGTLLVDLGNARLVEIGSDLSFGDTRPITLGSLGPGMALLLPVGTDSSGRIYYEERPGGMTGSADSATIARFDPSSDSSDEIGKRKLPDQKREESGSTNNQRVMVRSVPLSAQDAWSVGFDGSVAVARAGDYRLEWIRPDGTLQTGTPVPYEAVRVGRAEKEEWIEALDGGLSIRMESDGGPPRLSFNRGVGGEMRGSADDYEWPEVKPPFVGGAVLVDRESRAWVQRQTEAGAPALFDVFSADGERTAQVELPADRRLVGFAEGTLYLTRSDALGFAWLERYEAPSL